MINDPKSNSLLQQAVAQEDSGYIDMPNTSKNDPLGGFSLVTGKRVSKYDAPGLRDISHVLGGQDPVTFMQYGVPIRETAGDLNELRARFQPTSEKIKNGLKKAAVTFSAALVENLAALPGALYEATFNKNPEMSALYDNPVTRMTSKWRDWSQENFVNYLTKEEQNRTTDEKLATGLFWANEVADGMAYSLASMATALVPMRFRFMPVTRAVKTGLKASQMASKSSRLKRMADLWTKVQKSDRTTAQGPSVSQRPAQTPAIRNKTKYTPGSDLMDELGSVSGKKPFDWAGFTAQAETAMAMSMAEAGVEARDARDSFIAEALSKREVSMEDLSQEEQDELNKVATEHANAVFAINMGILSLSNATMFNGLIKRSLGMPTGKGMTGFKYVTKDGKSVRRTLNQWLRGDKPYSASGPLKLAEDIPETMWGRAGRVAKDLGAGILKSAPNEAFQEGAQFATTQGSADYFMDKYIDAGTEDLISSMAYGLKETFHTQEGREAMLIGAIVGGIMGGSGAVTNKIKSPKTKEREKKALLEFIDMYNNGFMNSTIASVNYADFVGALNTELEYVKKAYNSEPTTIHDLGKIKQEEYEEIVNEGKISNSRAFNIALKLNAGVKLSAAEKQAYNAHKDMIDAKAMSAKQTEEEQGYYRGNEERMQDKIEEIQWKILQQEAAFHLQRGTFEYFLDKIKDSENLTDEEFADLYGIDVEMLEQANQAIGNAFGEIDPEVLSDMAYSKRAMIDRLTQQAKGFEEIFNKVENYFGEFQSSNPKTEDEKLEEFQRMQQYLAGKDILYMHLSQLRYNDAKVDEIAKELAERFKSLNEKELLDLELEDFEPGETTTDENGNTVKKMSKIEEIVEKLTENEDPVSARLARELLMGSSPGTSPRGLFKYKLYQEQTGRAIEQLLMSDKAFEKYIEKKIGRQSNIVKARRAAAFEMNLANAKTPADVETIMTTDLTEEQSARAKKRFDELSKAVESRSKELRKKSLATLEEEAKKITDPFEQAAYAKAIKDKKGFVNEGKEDPLEGAEPETKKEKKEKKKKEQDKDPEETKDAPQEGHVQDEPGTNVQDITELGADDLTEREDQNPPEEEPEAAPAYTVVVAPHYTYDKEGKNKVVIVDDEGNAVVREEIQGLSQESPINYTHILSPDFEKGTEVELQLADPEANNYKTAEILIIYKGDIIGRLLPGDTGPADFKAANAEGRKQMFKALRHAKVTGDRVLAKVANKEMWNTDIANSRDNVGNKYFHNPTDTFSNRYVPVRNDKGGYDYVLAENLPVTLAVVVGTEADTVEVKLNNANIASSETVKASIAGMSTKNLTPGQVLAVTVAPTSEGGSPRYMAVPLSTAYLTEAAIQKALSMMTAEDAAGLAELVGMNTLKLDSNINPKFLNIRLFDSTVGKKEGYPTIDFSQDREELLELIKKYDASATEMSIYYYSPMADNIVKISATELQKVLSGQTAEPSISIMEVEEIEKDEKKYINYTAVTDKYLANPENLKEIQAAVKEELTAVLKQSRFQVSKEKANTTGEYISPVTGQTYNSYNDYLFDGTELTDGQGAQREEGAGHYSIVSTDIKNVGGGIHHIATNFRIGEAYLESEKPVTEPTAEEQQEEKPEKKAPATKSPKRKSKLRKTDRKPKVDNEKGYMGLFKEYFAKFEATSDEYEAVSSFYTEVAEGTHPEFVSASEEEQREILENIIKCL